MLKYGKRIVDALLGKRAERTTVRAELGPKVQADSDRSDIRVFEIGLSAEQHGDYEHGTGNAAQAAESTRLIQIAKNNGLFVNKSAWGRLGQRKRLASGESIVYLSEDEQWVTKVRNPFAKTTIKSLHAQDVIYEHLIHNILFPSTKYTFMGISEDIDGMRILLRQRYLKDQYVTPTTQEIEQHLTEGLGLALENRYYYGNEWIAITDVSASGDNVLSDGKQLYFIDPIIKFKQPASLVLEHYHSLLA